MRNPPVNQGHLVPVDHIPGCVCPLLFLQAPLPSDGTITPLWHQIRISPSTRLHPRALFSTCDRTRPLLMMAGFGGGVVWEWCERGRRQTSSPSVFPLQLLSKCWWRCFEAAYCMWRREAERMPSGLILPQLSGANWARSSRLPKALYIYPPRYRKEEKLVFASWKLTLFPINTNKVTQGRGFSGFDQMKRIILITQI